MGGHKGLRGMQRLWRGALGSPLAWFRGHGPAPASHSPKAGWRGRHSVQWDARPCGAAPQHSRSAEAQGRGGWHGGWGGGGWGAWASQGAEPGPPPCEETPPRARERASAQLHAQPRTGGREWEPGHSCTLRTCVVRVLPKSAAEARGAPQLRCVLCLARRLGTRCETSVAEGEVVCGPVLRCPSRVSTARAVERQRLTPPPSHGPVSHGRPWSRKSQQAATPAVVGHADIGVLSAHTCMCTPRA